MPHVTVHHFGGCELDETRRQLRRDGAVVRIGPRVFDLLIHLVRQAHRVVPHGELRASVWNGQAISDAAVHACACRAREAIGDRDDAVPMIRTFTRYGYRFAADVRTELRTAARRLESGPPDAPVDGRSSAPAPTAGLFGRTEELGILSATLEEAVGGRGRLAIVRGDHGAGKTRLAKELAELATAHGVEVLHGQCDESHGAPSFWPWAQIVRRYASRREPEAIRAALGSAAADVARIAPALRDRCPELGERPVPDPDQAEIRVHESLLGFVARAAAAEPLLIVVDDAQWADAASVRVLRALAEELLQTRALVLVLMEPSAADAFVDTHGSVRVELGRLSTAAVGDVIEHAVGQAAPVDVIATIATLSDGNPFVVLDTLAHLRAAELLPPQQPTWPDRDTIAHAGLGNATCAMVTRRLRPLDATCRRVLGVAAVAGDEFAFGVLDHVAGLGGHAALAAIESAAHAGLIRSLDTSGTRYRFTAPYLRAAIRQSLNPTRLAYLQAQLATAPDAGR